MRNLVIYNHGKDSIPWGEKALAFAEVAKCQNFEFISLDYRPCNDPDERLKQLLAMDWSTYQSIVLVGSSMGGYVITVASEHIKPKGLFMIAPAFYLPGYQRTVFKPTADYIEIFHGWQDEVVPVENVLRFCQQYDAHLHLLNADHRLLSILPIMLEAFEHFLVHCQSE